MEKKFATHSISGTSLIFVRVLTMRQAIQTVLQPMISTLRTALLICVPRAIRFACQMPLNLHINNCKGTMIMLRKKSQILKSIHVSGLCMLGAFLVSQEIQAQPPTFCFCECQAEPNGPSSGVKGTYEEELQCVFTCQRNYGNSSWHRCKSTDPFGP